MNSSTKRVSALGGTAAVLGLAAFTLVFPLALAGCPTANDEADKEAKIPRYTVTFNTMGGSAIAEQTVKENSAVDKPTDPDRAAFDFGGWFYADGRAVTWPITVTADVMVYARWSLRASVQAGLYEGSNDRGSTGLLAALDWIKDNAASGGNYTVVLGQTETVPPQSLVYTGKQVTITLASKNPHTVNFTASPGASLFAVGANVTLYLEDNVTLQGTQDEADKSLVEVDSGRFVMNGGTITGNRRRGNGGGVYVITGTFIMNNGSISENTGSVGPWGGGGGVDADTFTMTGGTISGNTTSTYGGGVHAYTFTMSGGTISGNTAGNQGGGVYASYSGRFTKSGGIIYGSDVADDQANRASSDSYGHAVYTSGGQKRNTTARSTTAMDSSKDGAAGGWE